MIITKIRIFFVVCVISLLMMPQETMSQVLVEENLSVDKEDSSSTGYVYDLKDLIKKSRQSIKGVDQKIKEQAILKRNQQREQKAREYYEQAQQLAQEGRLKESRQLYEKAIRITEHPEMKRYVKYTVFRGKSQVSALKKQEVEAQRLTDEQQRLELDKIEQAYQKAVSLYKQTKFQQAKESFEYVEEMYPNYKAVRSYLQIVEQDIFQADQTAIKNQQKEISRQQKELEVARSREKEQWRKEIQQKEQQREEQLKQQADGVYQEAIKLYKQRKYAAAKEKFREVDWVLPDYKAVRAYLVRIDRDIEKDHVKNLEEQQRELREKNWEMAVKDGKKEMTLKEAQEQKEKERLVQVQEQAEFLYTAALALFEQDKIAQAKEKFQEVHELYPQYKETLSYIQKIEQILADQAAQEMARKKAEEEKRIWGEEAARKKAEKDLFEQKAIRAEALYQEASTLYKTGRLIEAKGKLVEVNQLIPDYKSTQILLKRIDKDIELIAKTLMQESVLSQQQAEIEQMKKKRDEAEKLYMMAVASYANKQYEKARDEFNQVQQIYKDYKKTSFYLSRVDEDIKQQQDVLKQKEKERQTEISYQEAVGLYQQGLLEEAKGKFIYIQSVLADYKLTSEYLNKIDDEILIQKEKELAHLRQVQVEQPYAQAVSLYLQKDFVGAKAKFLEVVALMPNYKDTEKYIKKIDFDIEQQKKQEEDERKKQEAESEYIKAVSLYQRKDFVEAKKNFIRTEIVYPDYKDVGRYLARIDKDIIEKKKQDEENERIEKVTPLYLEAVSFYKQREFLEAKNSFEKAQIVYPGYKDIDAYLSRVEREIVKRQERIEQLEKNRQAEQFYLEAMTLYAKQQFLEAKEKFIQTSLVNPQYKNVPYYLKRIDTDIEQHAYRIEQLKKETKADVFYTEALELYHSRQFEEAKEFFLQVENVLSGYKKTTTYLRQIDKNIKEFKKEQDQQVMQRVEHLYQQAQVFLHQKKMESAFENFYIIEILLTDYKNVRDQLKEAQAVLLKDQVNVNALVVQATLKAKQEKENLVLIEENTSEKTARSFYQQAVKQFQQGAYDQAKEDFQYVALTYPQYRQTEKYLLSIDILKDLQQQRFDMDKISEFKKVKKEPEIKVVKEVKQEKKEEVKQTIEDFVKEEAKFKKEVIQQPKEVKKEIKKQVKKEIKKEVKVQPEKIEPQEDVFQKAEALYIEALVLYKEGKHQEAKQLFEQIESFSKNYKSTKTYLRMIQEVMGKENMPAVVTSVVVDRSVDQDEAIIRELMARSERIYRQIKTLAEDKDLASTKRTFAKVDKILANIEAEQKKVSLEIERRKKQEKIEAEQQIALKKQEEKKEEKQVVHTQKDIHQQEVERKKQEEIETKKQQKELIVQENKKLESLYREALYLYRLSDYAQAKIKFVELHEIRSGYKNVDQMITRCERKESEQQLVEAENKDRQELMRLAQTATDMNVEILALSQQRNYEQIKLRFSDLESLLKQIQSIKNTMISRRDEWAERWNKKVNLQQEKTNKLLKEKAQSLTKEAEGRSLKTRAIAFYKEGQQLFSAKKYAEAKVKFMEALKLDMTLKAARTYIQKINELLAKDEQQFQLDVKNRVEKKMRTENEEIKKPFEEKEALLDQQKRLRSLMEEARLLYKQNRYRESRIKFESLKKEGDRSYQKNADRYLALIEKALEQERQTQEKEERLKEERYLQERLDALKANLQEKNKVQEKQMIKKEQQRMKLFDARQNKASVVAQKETQIERQQILNQEAQMNKKASIKPSRIKAEGVSSQPPVVDLKKFYEQKRKVDQENARLLAKEAALRKQMEEEKQKSVLLQEKKLTTSDVLIKSKENLLLDQARSQQQLEEKQTQAIYNNINQGVDRLYQDAESLYSIEEYEKAYEYFKQIDQISPAYKKTKAYLKRLNVLLKPKQELHQISQEVFPAESSSDMMKSSAVGHALDLFDPQVK